MGSAEAAELTKLAETTYRDVNIAFANELARYADRLGLDVRAVIDAANSQPYSHIHRPGVAVGGHCIPVYPHFLLGRRSGRAPARAVAREVNDAMPAYAVDLLAGELGLAATAARSSSSASPTAAASRSTRSRAPRRCATSCSRAARRPLVERPAVRAPPSSRRPATSRGTARPPSTARSCRPTTTSTARSAPADLGGARVVVDGRGVLDRAALRGGRRARAAHRPPDLGSQA